MYELYLVMSYLHLIYICIFFKVLISRLIQYNVDINIILCIVLAVLYDSNKSKSWLRTWTFTMIKFTQIKTYLTMVVSLPMFNDTGLADSNRSVL